MTVPDNTNNDEISQAARKQHLREQGAFYRAGIVNARQEIRQGLHAAPLAKGMMAGVGGMVFEILRGSTGGQLSLVKALLPLLAGGASALWSKKGGRSAMYVGIAMALATTVARLIARKKNPPSEESTES